MNSCSRNTPKDLKTSAFLQVDRDDKSLDLKNIEEKISNALVSSIVSKFLRHMFSVLFLPFLHCFLILL